MPWVPCRVRYEGPFCRAGSMWARQFLTLCDMGS